MSEIFPVGEEIIFDISYAFISAGQLTLKVLPPVKVNGKKSYHFSYYLKTNSFFNLFYFMDDVGETFVDYETFLPHSYKFLMQESDWFRRTLVYFKRKKQKGLLWDRYKKKGGNLQTTQKEWDIKAKTHDAFSLIYYLRTLDLSVGDHVQSWVGYAGKNVHMSGEVLRKEKVDTPYGYLDCFVLRLYSTAQGQLTPTGENLLWITSDSHRWVVRFEFKLKVGSLVGKAIRINK